MNGDESTDRALLVAMPLRHLEAARAICEERGTAVLPAGGPGDLDAAPAGLPVLVIATDAGDEEVPAVTWRAVLVGRVPHATGEPWPELVPDTWAEERSDVPDPDEAADPESDDEPDPEDEADEDDDDDDDDGIGPQSFLEVRELTPVPRAEWIFANELVPKQQRGGRTFVPRTPRLIRFVD